MVARAAGEILGESSPRCEIQFRGLLELGEIAIEARPFGEQSKNTALVEHIHVVFPHHVIDGGKPAAVSH